MRLIGKASVSSFLTLLLKVASYAKADLNVLAIVHGLIILVIAEVFRAGTRLDEDQSLTI